MRKQIIRIAIPLVLILLYLAGPRPEAPIYNTSFPKVNSSLVGLADSISKAEAANKAIKPNNEARIVWANDSLPVKTPWAIVYLHGFTASQMEGDPVHRDIARVFGMNLYLARLSDHGLASERALEQLSPDRLWETAKQALAIGHHLGNRVILMSTSTGGTLALKLAQMFPEKVDALINYSPNVRINNPVAPLLNKPWGEQIATLALGRFVDSSSSSDSLISQYWTVKYRTNALCQLEELVETTMTTQLFEQIDCPSLTVAYFKDKKHQDPTVKVSAQRWMHQHLATAESQKRYVELASVGVHPLASGLRSKDIQGVEAVTKAFINEVLLTSH